MRKELDEAAAAKVLDTSTWARAKLIRLARQAKTISVSEMLPGPDGLWLGDSAGRRYVSELRLLAVDPEPWRPEPIWAR